MSLNRRAFLRGTGVCLSLPLLDAMLPVWGAEPTGEVPRRMVAAQTNMGILPQFFFPEQAGRECQPSAYLEILKRHRSQMTVFSGVSHSDVDGAHSAEKCFLTAAPHPGSPTFKNTISVDQLAAEQMGALTRFPSLTLSNSGSPTTLSVTRSGVVIPAEKSPSKLYEKLFVEAGAAETQRRIRELRKGRSLLDFVAESSRQLQGKVGARDKERLDQYFTSVRDLEKRLVRLEAWQRRPKPKVDAKSPKDVTSNAEFVEQSKLMYEMIRLALQTDSTRLITFFVDTTPIHNITHHGNRPETLQELRAVESEQFRVLDEFLSGLAETPEAGGTLLDHTMVLYGTCMGNANSHSNHNLPVLLAGGGFKHAGHLKFDTTPGKNYPLPNLYVSMLQRMGLPVEKFASSTGTMSGLETT